MPALNTSSRLSPQRHHLDRRANALAAQCPGDASDLIDSRQLANWFGVSKLWVELGRTKNYGPPFVRLGPKLIRYRIGDVSRWLDARANASRGADK
jgi:predicted DNA-binding transcriptional regulator AlpA